MGETREINTMMCLGKIRFWVYFLAFLQLLSAALIITLMIIALFLIRDIAVSLAVDILLGVRVLFLQIIPAFLLLKYHEDIKLLLFNPDDSEIFQKTIDSQTTIYRYYAIAVIIILIINIVM